MSTQNPESPSTMHAPGYFDSRREQSNVRWVVCGLLFLATTINYMDRQVFSLIEPALHNLPFMGWDFSQPANHQPVFNNNFGNVLIFFQIAYGIGFLIAGRVIDRLGTKLGYALAILIWGLASMSHALVGSVIGFCIARFALGIGESGNFPAAIKATTEWFPSEERAFATGIFNSGSNAASLVAPILVPIVVLKWGWYAAFITTGSMGMAWLVLWLIFPYNMLRARYSTSLTQEWLQIADSVDLARRSHEAGYGTGGSFKRFFIDLHLTNRRTWAFAIAKGFTDPIWWFYLFWLPKYFNENYGLDLKHIGLPIIVIYTASSVGSIFGGWLSGNRIKAGHTVNYGRKFAMFSCGIFALPVMFVPLCNSIAPGNVWLPVFLLSIAAAAHQGWSANLFSTPTDMFPSTAVSTVVGIGGAAGAAGGAVFTWFVKTVWSTHPTMIFGLAALSYMVSLAIFHLIVPRLGAPETV